MKKPIRGHRINRRDANREMQVWRGLDSSITIEIQNTTISGRDHTHIGEQSPDDRSILEKVRDTIETLDRAEEITIAKVTDIASIMWYELKEAWNEELGDWP